MLFCICEKTHIKGKKKRKIYGNDKINEEAGPEGNRELSNVQKEGHLFL